MTSTTSLDRVILAGKLTESKWHFRDVVAGPRNEFVVTVYNMPKSEKTIRDWCAPLQGFALRRTGKNVLLGLDYLVLQVCEL